MNMTDTDRRRIHELEDELARMTVRAEKAEARSRELELSIKAYLYANHSPESVEDREEALQAKMQMVAQVCLFGDVKPTPGWQERTAAIIEERSKKSPYEPACGDRFPQTAEYLAMTVRAEKAAAELAGYKAMFARLGDLISREDMERFHEEPVYRVLHGASELWIEKLTAELAAHRAETERPIGSEVLIEADAYWKPRAEEAEAEVAWLKFKAARMPDGSPVPQVEAPTPVPVPCSDRLVVNLDISDVSPVVKGTWVTVAQVVGRVVDGWSWAEILRGYPELTEADIRACLDYDGSPVPPIEGSVS